MHVLSVSQSESKRRWNEATDETEQIKKRDNNRFILLNARLL